MMSSKGSRAVGQPGATAEGAAVPSAADPAASYEHARDELAQVVGKLEAGGLSLDDSLTLWERGEQLARQCAAFLDGARDRVDAALAEAAGNAED